MNWNKTLHIVAFTLLLIGGLDWGLIGLFGFDLLDFVFGDLVVVQQVIQTLVGVSAVYVLFTHKGDCKICGGK